MKKSIAILLFLLLFLVGCNSSTSNISKNNNKLTVNYKDFKGFDLQKDDLNLKINGQELNFNMPVYIEKNRYYFPLNELCEKLNGTIEKDDDNLNLNLDNIQFSINLINNKVAIDDKEITLKNSIKSENNFYYISFSDLSNILSMYTRWDKTTKTISCRTKDDSLNNITPYKSKISQVGYLRIEDVDLTTQDYDKEFLEKLRIIGHYLCKKNIPYHIAWIPRYLSPKQNIDVDPVKLNDFTTAEMIYTLDYFLQNNGLIGLHGYTHQNENEESAVGSEFGPKHPSLESFKSRIEKSLETAKYLDIPVSFFEAPHYQITAEQNKLAEEYFKILYYPFEDNGPSGIDLTKPQLSPYNKSSHYISTPLDYIPEGQAESALNKIRNIPTSNMGSIFYHPRLEFQSITLSESNEIPSFTYSNDSILNKIINILEEKGYKMSKVTDIK